MLDRTYYPLDGRGVAYQGRPTGTISSNGYYTFRVKGKTYYNHKFVWELHNGPVPTGFIIDHVDGNRLNNRIENLRLASRSQNNMNAKHRSMSRGVDKPKNSSLWRVRITACKKVHSVSGFETEALALDFADLLRKELHGGFYRE